MSTPDFSGRRALEGRGRTALVTGASSGIGRSMTELLAARGFDVVVVARREDRLNALKEELEPSCDVTVRPLVADLAESATPATIVDALDRWGVEVDFLVNNAGYSQLGRYSDLDWSDHQRRLQVLGLSVLELTHHLLPSMVKRGWGRIINVASIAAFFESSPNDVLYSATKSMIHKFSEGIAAEYAASGVNCTVSVPGFTDTEIFTVSKFSNHVQSNRVMRMAMMSPDTVARQAYDAVAAGKRCVVHGRHHQAMAALLQHCPQSARRLLAVRLVGSIQSD